MEKTVKDEPTAEFELARKIYECYRFLAETAGDNKDLLEKIDALAEEHLLAVS